MDCHLGLECAHCEQGAVELPQEIEAWLPGTLVVNCVNFDRVSVDKGTCLELVEVAIVACSGLWVNENLWELAQILNPNDLKLF
jgi:hypothetical protein